MAKSSFKNSFNDDFFDNIVKLKNNNFDSKNLQYILKESQKKYTEDNKNNKNNLTTHAIRLNGIIMTIFFTYSINRFSFKILSIIFDLENLKFQKVNSQNYEIVLASIFYYLGFYDKLTSGDLKSYINEDEAIHILYNNINKKDSIFVLSKDKTDYKDYKNWNLSTGRKLTILNLFFIYLSSDNLSNENLLLEHISKIFFEEILYDILQDKLNLNNEAKLQELQSYFPDFLKSLKDKIIDEDKNKKDAISWNKILIECYLKLFTFFSKSSTLFFSSFSKLNNSGKILNFVTSKNHYDNGFETVSEIIDIINYNVFSLVDKASSDVNFYKIIDFFHIRNNDIHKDIDNSLNKRMEFIKGENSNVSDQLYEEIKIKSLYIFLIKTKNYEILKKFLDFEYKEKEDTNLDFFGRAFSELFENSEKNETKDTKKTKGQYHTPINAIKFMISLLLNDREIDWSDKKTSVYDPCGGSGAMLTTFKNFVFKEILRHTNNAEYEERKKQLNTNIIYRLQEIDRSSWIVSNVNSIIYGLSNFYSGEKSISSTKYISAYNHPKSGLTEKPTKISSIFVKKDYDQSQKYDYIITNPPFNLESDIDENNNFIPELISSIIEENRDSENKSYLANLFKNKIESLDIDPEHKNALIQNFESIVDINDLDYKMNNIEFHYFWIFLLIFQLKKDGKMVIILPSSIFDNYKNNKQNLYKFQKILLSLNYLDAVFTTKESIFYNINYKSIAFLVIDKNRTKDCKHIFYSMINASHFDDEYISNQKKITYKEAFNEYRRYIKVRDNAELLNDEQKTFTYSTATSIENEIFSFRKNNNTIEFEFSLKPSEILPFIRSENEDFLEYYDYKKENFFVNNAIKEFKQNNINENKENFINSHVEINKLEDLYNRIFKKNTMNIKKDNDK